MPLVPSYIKKLKSYKPGKPIEEVQRELGLDDIIKLASNENPLGPSPKALSAIQNSMTFFSSRMSKVASWLASPVPKRFEICFHSAKLFSRKFKKNR